MPPKANFSLPLSCKKIFNNHHLSLISSHQTLQQGSHILTSRISRWERPRRWHRSRWTRSSSGRRWSRRSWSRSHWTRRSWSSSWRRRRWWSWPSWSCYQDTSISPQPKQEEKRDKLTRSRSRTPLLPPFPFLKFPRS
jgi:hypothetical protein